MLQSCKLVLLLGVHHFGDCACGEVPESVLGIDKVVAGVYVAVEFHHTGMAARTCHRANARRHPHPIGERGVKKLNIVLSYVVHYPFIEDGINLNTNLLSES